MEIVQNVFYDQNRNKLEINNNSILENPKTFAN